MRGYLEQPSQHFERIAIQRGEEFSGHPAINDAGLFYQAIGNDRYVLRWSHDGRDEELVFEGHAFCPSTRPGDRSVYFELVAQGGSTTMRFDPFDRKTTRATIPVNLAESEYAVSPNGRWAAIVSQHKGDKRISLRDLSNGSERILTSGSCNSWEPAWEKDSTAIVFASDCGRGLGLPALYRDEIR